MSAYEVFFAVVAFVLGSVIGSFLNVVIYRLPAGISLRDPSRSFCPGCRRTIPWRQNIPLLSWVLLRGRCAGCGARIPVRYLVVEGLCAALFLALWLQAWPRVGLAVGWWVLGGILLSATFIDLEHFIIPDEITWGGVGAGLVFSILMPEMVGARSALGGLTASVIGAAVGYGLLYGVVEMGKLMLGRRVETYDPPGEFRVRLGEAGWEFRVGEETIPWEEIFSRPSDRLRIDCEGEVRVGGETLTPGALEIRWDRIGLGGGKELRLGHEGEGASGGTRGECLVGEVCGLARRIVIPREAMGLGDVKFLAAIGAFLGWRATVFSVAAGSVLGSLIGLTLIAMGRREWGKRLPFGPYLAAGAFLWMFGGSDLIDWYIGFVGSLIEQRQSYY